MTFQSIKANRIYREIGQERSKPETRTFGKRKATRMERRSNKQNVKKESSSVLNTDVTWFDHAWNMTEQEHKEHMQMRKAMFDLCIESIKKSHGPVVIVDRPQSQMIVGDLLGLPDQDWLMVSDGQFESDDIWGDDDLPY